MAVVARAGRDVQSAVEDAIRRALERGELGLGVAVYHNGDLVADAFGGIADEATGREVAEDTLFWIASVSKAFTATALHIQAERGYVDYSAPIAEYWPEFGVHGKERATVLDALSHRAGVPVFPLDATPELMCDYEWVADRIANSHPIYEPGTRNAYHGYTFGWVVGEVVRRTDPEGRSLREFIHDELFGPVGAGELWFGIPDELEPRVTKYRLERDVWRGHDVVMPYHPSLSVFSGVFNRPDVHRSFNPSAGAIGNARSVARVFAMLANGGELDGARLLSEDRVRMLAAPRPYGWDLVRGVTERLSIGGFWLPHTDGLTAPMGRGLQIIGQPGSAGNLAWCDVNNRLAVAITANRMGGRESADQNPLVDLADTIRASLGIDGS